MPLISNRDAGSRGRAKCSTLRKFFKKNIFFFKSPKLGLFQNVFKLPVTPVSLILPPRHVVHYRLHHHHHHHLLLLHQTKKIKEKSSFSLYVLVVCVKQVCHGCLHLHHHHHHHLHRHLHRHLQ